MPNGRSREDFIQFLDYLGDKGLVAKATASARRTAAVKILDVLSEDEAADVTMLDIDDTMARFDNLNPRQYTPESLQTYRSRLNKGLEDFCGYLDNPVTFRPRTANRPKKEATGRARKSSGQHMSASPPATASSTPAVELPNANLLPISLRANLTVRVFGLPFDLSKAEATKIANIILAHALVED